MSQARHTSCSDDYEIGTRLRHHGEQFAQWCALCDDLIDLLEDEPFICDLMDLCVNVAIEFARVQVEAGADTIGIGDAIAERGPERTRGAQRSVDTRGHQRHIACHNWD